MLRPILALALVAVTFAVMSEVAKAGYAASGNGNLTSGALSVAMAGTGYRIDVEGEPWFISGATEFSADGKTFSTADGTLAPAGTPSAGAASDLAGSYDFIKQDWASATKQRFSTVIKAYRGGRSQLVFQSIWPDGAAGTAGSQFPALVQSTGKRLGTLEYTGSSCGFMVSPKDAFSVSGGKGKGMIAVVPLDAGTGTSASLVVGPVTEHFANQAHGIEGGFAYGMAASFEFAPPNYTIETVIVATSKASPSPGEDQPERASMPTGGANAALAEYGDYVLGRHGKDRAGPNHTSEVAHIGYSTTGFYFYNFCDCLDPNFTHHSKSCSNPAPNLPGCRTYEDTLYAVNDKLEDMGIPIKHFLLDSWWYGEGVHGGAFLWEDLGDCVGNGSDGANSFPSGMKAFADHIGQDKTIWAHNGKWVDSTPYKATYPFSGTIPQGPEMWRHLFKANKQWNLNTIKQDHIGEQMGGSPDSWKNVSVLKSWLSGMGTGASENDAHVLYCCAPPNIHMNGVTVPAAFAVRASPDYVVGGADGTKPLNLPTVQWAIGPDAAFHWSALGLLPYKDTFFSNTSMMTESKESRFVDFTESNPLTHALMATLSMAQVTFSDGIGMTNKSLVMMICRDDGVILKPDRPATAIDAQFNAMMFGGWPGSSPPPRPGPHPGPSGSIAFQKCNATDPRQQWITTRAGGLGITAGKTGAAGCMNVGGCRKNAGADVHIFAPLPSEPAGCGTHSDCNGLNEQFALADGQIRSALGGKDMCVSVSAGRAGSAELERCSKATAVFKIPADWPGPIKSATDEALCLHGDDPAADRPWRPAGDDDAAAGFVPTDWEATGLSHNYAGALQISEELLHKIETRARNAGEECSMAPQGPKGEVYSTHTTIGDHTWRYVVGVQLSTALNVTPDMLGFRGAGTSAPLVQFAWSDSETFRQAASTVPAPFSATHPIALKAAVAKGLGCDTSGPVDQYSAPIQYHTVAPVFADSGWVFLGEALKLVPISRQRITQLAVSASGFTAAVVGKPGESVVLGAFHPGQGSVYATCVLDTAGAATFTADATGGVKC